MASDVFQSGAAVDRLLFGSLLALGPADLTLSAVTVAAFVAVATTRALGRTWAAIAFDPDGAPSLGLPVARRADFLLLGAGGRGGGRGNPGGRGALVLAATRPARLPPPDLLARTILGPPRLVGRVRARPGGAPGLYVAYWLDLPPRLPVAVIGSLSDLRAYLLWRWASQ